VKKVFKNIADGKRSVGKPRKRWLDDVENYMQKMGVTDWRRVTRDRDECKLILKKAKVQHGPYIQRT
jgi:hypothetical protein